MDIIYLQNKYKGELLKGIRVMKKLWLRILKLFIGLFIASLGVVFMLNANIGLPPWDVLHSGVGKLLGNTIGQAIIIVSIILTIVSVYLGEKIGIGTICNVIFIGLFVDIIKKSGIVPISDNFISGFIMMNTGMMVLAIGSVLYISSELCCGAKDAVTMGLTRKFNRPVKYVRAILELVVIIIGISIGGDFSFMTIYAAMFFGYFMQGTFKLFNCNPQELKHQSILDMIK